MRSWTLVLLLFVSGLLRAQTPASAAASPAPPASPAQITAAPVPPESGPQQPVPFSHKIHAGTGKLACETCHVPSQTGESLSIPQAAACMQCHQAIATDKPGVQQLAIFAKPNRTIPWVRLYQVPSFVTFSHKTHAEHGNSCVECHGRVAQREVLSKETDISMAGCLACHRVKEAAVGCETCHAPDPESQASLHPETQLWASVLRSGTAGNTRSEASLARFLTTLSRTGGPFSQSSLRRLSPELGHLFSEMHP